MGLPQLGYLTAERCAQISHSLCFSVKQFALVLRPPSPLSAVINDLEWMALFPSGSMVDGGTRNIARSRVIKDIPHVEQAELIAGVLAWVWDIKGADGALCLKDNIDRLSTLNERAQELLFELEVGGRLTARGVPVSYAEQDIRLDLPDLSLGIPCKHPRKAKNIVRNVRDGVKQLQRTALTEVGSFLSSLSCIPPPLLEGYPQTNRPTNWLSDTWEEADETTQPRIREEIITPLESQLNALLQTHNELAEVLFCGVFTTLLRSLSAYVDRWLNDWISSPNDTQHLTERVGKSIQGSIQESS